MKTMTKAMLTALILLSVSCKKENSIIQSASIANESNSQTALLTTNEVAGQDAVRIGKQVWKIKNLSTSYYRNGDKIPEVRNKSAWLALKTGAWCWYSNDSANGSVYGKLYNWYAVNDPRGLAPEGWHIASDSEWTTLTTYLGGEFMAGGKLKSTGTIEAGTGLWHTPNTDATNSTGFIALPGGYRNYDGKFYKIGYYGYWYSSTFANNRFYSRAMFYNDAYLTRYYGKSFDMTSGYYVRCIKD